MAFHTSGCGGAMFSPLLSATDYGDYRLLYDEVVYKKYFSFLTHFPQFTVENTFLPMKQIMKNIFIQRQQEIAEAQKFNKPRRTRATHNDMKFNISFVGLERLHRIGGLTANRLPHIKP